MKDGKWFAVDALDGAFIDNVGDTLEILSNGKFRNAEHRAVIHPNKERISVAMFHYPRQDHVVSPLPEFVKDDKVHYRSTSYQDFLMQFFKAKLDGKNHLERLKLEQ
uniref:Isopenicillin N synthase-like Fe(2+) 2OG dioxygenase domain-containing protein n=1 Tax=Arundo donax TaxID=35708 RepID=A0A0A8XUJ1_ARUDO